MWDGGAIRPAPTLQPPLSQLPRDVNGVLDVMSARAKLIHKGVSLAGVCSRLAGQFLAYQVRGAPAR